MNIKDQLNIQQMYDAKVFTSDAVDELKYPDLTDADLREAIRTATGKPPGGRSSRKSLEAQYQAALSTEE